MNNQIKELAEQAGFDLQYNCGPVEGEGEIYYATEFEKFAELVALKCIAQCEKHDPHPDQWSDMSEYTARRVARNCVESIKQTFGIK